MNNTPNDVKSGKVCSRVFKGATTIKTINGIACCPSCNQPINSHMKSVTGVVVPTNKKKRR